MSSIRGAPQVDLVDTFVEAHRIAPLSPGTETDGFVTGPSLSGLQIFQNSLRAYNETLPFRSCNLDASYEPSLLAYQEPSEYDGIYVHCDLLFSKFSPC